MQADEICEARRALDDLKHLLADKSNHGAALAAEAANARRLLDEKTCEAARLRDESVAKGNMCADLDAQRHQLTRDVEAAKICRADMRNEIAHLKDVSCKLTDEANHQAAQQAKLDADLAATVRQCEDTARLVDCRSADLRNKQIALEDTERELMSVRNLNAKLNNENVNLKSDNDHCAADNCAMRKNVDCQNV